MDAGLVQDACAGRPCLLKVERDEQFDGLARASTEGGCQFDQEVLFTIRRDGAESYFIDSSARRTALDFVRQDLGRAIEVDAYHAEFEAAATATWYTGRIRRRLPAQTPARYAFELDGTLSGTPTPAEFTAALEVLGRAFTLPLAYAPSTYDGLDAAEGAPIEVVRPEVCADEVCEPGPGPCLVVPEGAALCTIFRENRPIEAEVRSRMRLGLQPGRYRFRDQEALTLVTGGVHGLAGEAVAAPLAGAIAHAPTPASFWRWSQVIRAGTTTVTLELILPEDAGTRVLREPLQRNLYFTGLREGASPIDAALQFGSCSALGLSRGFVEARWGEDTLRLELRQSSPTTGVAWWIPSRADVVLGGRRITTVDRFDLVYAARHHYWDNNFLIFFPAPVDYRGHPIAGLAIDEDQFDCCPLDRLITVDRAGQPLDVLNVEAYGRSAAGP